MLRTTCLVDLYVLGFILKFFTIYIGGIIFDQTIEINLINKNGKDSLLLNI